MNRKNQNAALSSQQTNEPTKFAGDIIWVGIASLFNSVTLGLGTLPALTKFYSPAMFGVWTQILITYQLLSPLVALSLTLAVVRFLSGNEDKNDRRQALGTMLFVISIVASIFLIFANVMASQLSVLIFNSRQFSDFVRLAALWVVVNAYFSFLVAYMLSCGKIMLLSICQVILDLLTLGIIIIMATHGIQMEWVVASVVGIWILFTLWFFSIVIRDVGWPLPNTKGLKSYLSFSIPQIPAGILLWIIGSSDRYIITHFLGLSETGIYTSSDALGGLLWLIYYPIQFVLFPTISRLWEEKRFDDVKQYLEHSTRLFITLAIPAVAGITILSQPMLQIFTTSKYLLGDKLIFLIATSTLFMGIYSINVNVVYLRQQTKILPLMIGVAAIINILMNLILIPHIGLVGAAISNIVSCFILAVIVSLWTRRQISYNVNPLHIMKIIGATIIMSLCLFFIKVHSVIDFILVVALGILILIISLFLLKAISEHDKKLIKNILRGLIPSIKIK
jgi:O-antigen/teichoic acid export membrane protein